MRKLYTIIVLLVVLFALGLLPKQIHMPERVPLVKVVRVDSVKPVTKRPQGVLIKKQIPKKGVRAFMHSIGRMESKNNYKATNSIGMLGKYQFSPRTIRAMGFKVSNEEFLNNPALQDRVMLAFMRDNKRSLAPIIRKFNGQTVNGVRVSPSGVLAAAHLAGVGGVLSFFYPEKYGHYRTGDSNGATVAMYMEKFGHYNMEGM